MITGRLSLDGFRDQYKKQMKFLINRYCLPVEEDDWLETQGLLIETILRKNCLELNSEHALFFIFLVMNGYFLGPRIIREYFLFVEKESPRISERGCQKWQELIQYCKSLIDNGNGITYHDIVGRNAIKVRMDYFDRNIDRILNFKN